MNDLPAKSAEQHEPGSYEIRVRGHLDQRWAARLGVPDLSEEDNGTTALRGISVDQTALHGLLQRVRDLGLTLVSVTRTGPDHAAHDLSQPSVKPRNPK